MPSLAFKNKDHYLEPILVKTIDVTTKFTVYMSLILSFKKI